MGNQLLDNLERDSANIGAQPGRLEDVHRVSHRGHQDFGFVDVVAVDRNDILDQRHAVLRDVIEPPNER